jgi:hypothetical protein
MFICKFNVICRPGPAVDDCPKKREVITPLGGRNCVLLSRFRTCTCSVTLRRPF